jgi:glucan phosphoethanolaminetransferase (alkaline phosphatase superfamily)
LDAHNQLRAADKWMSIASAVLLAAYFVFALYAGASPSNDPQGGMAQGFIILVALLLVAVGGVLWFAVVRNHPWLLRTVFVFAVFPTLSFIAQQIFLLVRRAQ